MEGMNNKKYNLLKEIMEVDFRIVDLGLYLDTHIGDDGAIRMRNEAVKKSEMLKEMYEKEYGMLTQTAENNSGSWDWVDGPWPWEKMGV